MNEEKSLESVIAFILFEHRSGGEKGLIFKTNRG